MNNFLMASMCLSFDSQTSVNERLTRVVCLSTSFYVCICICTYIRMYTYIHTYVHMRTALVHALMTSIFVSYRNSCYSLFSFSFISFFPILHVTTSLTSLSFSLSHTHIYTILYTFFYSGLPVRTYIDFSRRVFVAHTSSFHFHSVVYVLCACNRISTCQRDKQLLLACRDGQLLTAPTVFPSLYGIGNTILTILRTTKQKLQVR